MSDKIETLNEIKVEHNALTDLFVKWWYNDWDDVRFFNEAIRLCPTLTAKLNKHRKGDK